MTTRHVIIDSVLIRSTHDKGPRIIVTTREGEEIGLGGKVFEKFIMELRLSKMPFAEICTGWSRVVHNGVLEECGGFEYDLPASCVGWFPREADGL